ncbi:hypothetical protein [Scytonema sp. PCC 10023]|uniref:hypothetical protein n=1 Tax=Scytonema sp. PCC 10023 TaxID=1680591 RepID=UPI0039C76055
MTVEADLVELAQKHVNDYASKWKKQLRLYGQEDKFWDWEFKLQFVISKQPNRERHKSPLSPESLRTRCFVSPEDRLRQHERECSACAKRSVCALRLRARYA